MIENKINEWDKTYMEMCWVMTRMSHGAKYKVASIITTDNHRIISTGLNGTPSGHPNADEVFDVTEMHLPDVRKNHRLWSEKFEIHAEMNAILWAQKGKNSLENATLYCTHKPCFGCLKHIIAAGIKKIVYSEEIKRIVYNENVYQFIQQSDVKLVKLEK